MKTMRVLVMVEIRANDDDDSEVREATKDALLEAIEDDTLEFTVEETEEEEDF